MAENFITERKNTETFHHIFIKNSRSLPARQLGTVCQPFSSHRLFSAHCEPELSDWIYNEKVFPLSTALWLYFFWGGKWKWRQASIDISVSFHDWLLGGELGTLYTIKHFTVLFPFILSPFTFLVLLLLPLLLFALRKIHFYVLLFAVLWKWREIIYLHCGILRSKRCFLSKFKFETLKCHHHFRKCHRPCDSN